MFNLMTAKWLQTIILLVPQVSTGNVSEQSADEKVKYFVSLFIFPSQRIAKAIKSVYNWGQIYSL